MHPAPRAAAYGVDAFRRQIEQNVAQAAYLAARVEAHPELELLAPVPLSVACFRYRPAVGPDEAALDALDRELLMRLHERGVAVPTSGRVRGRYGLRCAITNHRSRPTGRSSSRRSASARSSTSPARRGGWASRSRRSRGGPSSPTSSSARWRGSTPRTP